MTRKKLVTFGYILTFWGLLPGMLAALAAWGERVFGPAVGRPGLRAAAAALAALSGMMLAVAIVQYTKASGSLPVSAFPPRKLIRRGVFGVWRHPIYLFWALFVSGLATFFWPAGGLLLVFPCLALGTFIYARIEEAGLKKRFGGLYQGHLRQTSLVIPRLPYLVRPLLAVLCRLFFRFEVAGRENADLAPPFMVVSAHRNYLDPVFISVALNRGIHFVTTFEMFRAPGSRFIFSKLLSLPKKRYRPDIRNALDIRRRLSEGWVVGIFPEAERSWAGTMLPFKPEVLKLFRMYPGIPILPVRLEGAYAAWPRWARRPRRAKVSAVIGRPVFAGGARSPEALEAGLRRLIEPREAPAGSPQPAADGLEDLIYRCPECLRFDTVRSGGGPVLECSGCGAVFDLLSDLSVRKWGAGNAVSLGEIAGRIRVAGRPLSRDHGPSAFRVRSRLSIDRLGRRELIGDGSLELTSERLRFEAGGAPVDIGFDSIRSVLIEGARKLQVYGGRPPCLFHFSHLDQSALKWQDLVVAAVRSRSGCSPSTA